MSISDRNGVQNSSRLRERAQQKDEESGAEIDVNLVIYTTKTRESAYIECHSV